MKRIIKLKTNIKDKGFFKSKKKLLIEVSASNLWSIMMALREDRLVPRLQRQISKLSKELRKIGEKEFNWKKIR